MKSYDYDAVVLDCDVYCLECLPKGTKQNEYDPIFADSEWDSYPVCSECAEVHEYVNLTPDGVKFHQKEVKKIVVDLGEREIPEVTFNTFYLPQLKDYIAEVCPEAAITILINRKYDWIDTDCKYSEVERALINRLEGIIEQCDSEYIDE